MVMTKCKMLMVTFFVGCLCGCGQSVTTPTPDQLNASKPLADEWQAKCKANDLGGLDAGEKAQVCAAADAAEGHFMAKAIGQLSSQSLRNQIKK